MSRIGGGDTKNYNNHRETFENSSDIKPANASPNFPFDFGADLLTDSPGDSGGYYSGREDDEIKFEALRPYHDRVDKSNGNTSYTYYIEISDKLFEALLADMVRKDVDRVLVEKKREIEGTEYRFDEIHVGKLPHDVRFALMDHYALELNSESYHFNKVQKTRDNPFQLTVIVIESVKVGIQETENEVSLFDRFRVEFKACFHRSGKSIGHCARFVSLVETRDTSAFVLTEKAEHIGVLPESLAAKNTTSVR
jgi:hypothetical protein